MTPRLAWGKGEVTILRGKPTLEAFLAKHRPRKKWLHIIWKKVKLGPWEIPWIDKAYVFGRRFHHLELGLILIFIGWILVIHDWLVHERPKVLGQIETPDFLYDFEAESYEKREDGSVHVRRARFTRVRRVRRQPASHRYTREKIRGMKPRSAQSKRRWRRQVSKEELNET